VRCETCSRSPGTFPTKYSALIRSLPFLTPVRRYFEHVLKQGQHYISYVRLKHNGQFKTGPDKGWSKIDGEQYFTVEKPGFVWKGDIFGGSARDMYLSDKGRLVVTSLWLFTVVNGSGETFDEGELQRWIAESVWFPTNLLPSERISWSAIDDKTAKLSFKYKNVSTSFTVTFSDTGEITQMETTRFMDQARKERWLVIPSEYNETDGIIIPTKAEVTWKLEGGDLSYAKFRVKTIEYDKPKRF